MSDAAHPVWTGWTSAAGGGLLIRMATTPVTTSKRSHFGHRVRNELAAQASRHTVVVHHEWNGWRTATVRLSDLADVHWAQPAGAPRPLLHASVPSNRIVAAGALRDLGPSPRRVVVCVLKRHTMPWVFEELTRRADALGALRYPSPSLPIAGGRAKTHRSGGDFAFLARLAVGALPALIAIGAIQSYRRLSGTRGH